MKNLFFNSTLVLMVLGFNSCNSSEISAEESKITYKDTLHLISKYDSAPYPVKSLKYEFKELNGFKIKDDYLFGKLQEIELITNQTEFEEITTINQDSLKETPFIDFGNCSLLAILTDNKIAKRRGADFYYEPAHIFFKAKNCERKGKKIKFNFRIYPTSKQAEPVIPKLHLFQIYTKDANSISAMNKGIGRSFPLNRD